MLFQKFKILQNILFYKILSDPFTQLGLNY